VRRHPFPIAAPGAALCLLLLAGCDRGLGPPVRPAIGDPARGKVVMIRSGCGSCHDIPGVMHANGSVGPPLDRFARRTVVAGLLPNTPANLVRWLRDPQGVVPGNAMPNSGLDDQQARDAAAYLYTLK